MDQRSQETETAAHTPENPQVIAKPIQSFEPLQVFKEASFGPIIKPTPSQGDIEDV